MNPLNGKLYISRNDFDAKKFTPTLAKHIEDQLFITINRRPKLIKLLI